MPYRMEICVISARRLDIRRGIAGSLKTNIQENLQKLKGAKIFTSIDTCGEYHAIQIEEGSRDCTAFISWYILLYAFWPVKRRKCLQPDVGPGTGALTCGILAIIFGRHSGVFHGHLGPPEASEEHRGGSH